MDSNVYRILLGSSASGGIDPQIIRTNWSLDSVIGKFDDTTSLYLGYVNYTYRAPPFSYIVNGSQGTIVSMNASTGDLNWNRKIEPGGYSNFTEYQNTGSDIHGITNAGLFSFSSSNGSLTSGWTGGYGFSKITDSYYLTAGGNGVSYISRSNNTGWYSTISTSGTDSYDIQNAFIVGSNIYVFAEHVDGSPDQYSGTYYGRYSTSNGSYTLISVNTLGNYKILGVSSDNNYFYGYVPISGDSGNTNIQVNVNLGRVAKIQISNGSLVWGKDLLYTYNGGYSNYATKHAIFDPETEDIYLMGHWRPSNNDDGFVPIWKVNSSGNTEFIRQISSGTGQPQRIALDSDNMYLVGSNSNLDNGYGPSAIYILPKDGSLTGTHGATGYSDTASSYTVSSFTLSSKTARGITNTTGSSSLTSSSPTNGTNSDLSSADSYIVPVN